MIAVIIPAHNEEALIGACLRSLQAASRCPALLGEPVVAVVVADSCNDGTAKVARSMGAACVSVRANNVGLARARGAELALKAGARWLAFTDADSVVAPDWLSMQVLLRADAVCGVVQVNDWTAHSERTRRHFNAHYRPVDGHRHIHGANLGLSAQAYRRAGGFRHVVSSEDRALVEDLHTCGASIAWSAGPRVMTSARRSFRAPNGFGATLLRMGPRETTRTGSHDLRPASHDLRTVRHDVCTVPHELRTAYHDLRTGSRGLHGLAGIPL